MRRSRLSDVADEVQKEESAEHGRRKPSRFIERGNQLAGVVSDDRVEKTFLKVDPARCRMWSGHNRHYDLLDEKNCADLIEGLKAQGEQEFPAIVRRVTDDSRIDYEVICGARRHWAISWLRSHNFPRFKYLIEVRDLNDEEAFRLADAENRDRADISDFERAADYLQALDRYYDGMQKNMANRLEVSEGWLSRYLDLARLPKEIISAFAAVTDLRVQHAREIKPLLRDPKTKRAVLDCASDFEVRQREEQLKPEMVVKAFKQCAKGREQRKQGRPPLAEYQAANGAKILKVYQQGKGGLILRIKSAEGTTKDELLEACKEAIDTFAG
jgi:ParB family chromosome partitioning protein